MKRFLLFAFAVLMSTACAEDAITEQQSIQPIVDGAPETLVVGFEDDETRIQLNEAQKTVWTKGDLVSVFYRSNANQQWKYDGETGARTAELKRVDVGTATRDIDRVVVVYPYNEDYYINPETYNVQASLPAVQNYLKDSYGTNGNIMISSSEYNQFSLKSVCGWLKLQLTGDGEKVKSIKLRGNNGEQVAGELYISSADATAALAADMGSTDDNNAGGSLVFDDTILKEVTLDCGEGVELLPVVTSFYIAIPPQTFEKGFTVEIEDTDGYIMERSTDKVVTIERNTILPMAAFEFINPNHPTQSTPASNEIWYTATAKVEPFNSSAFGANILSNIYDEETGNGIFTFDSDITVINNNAFQRCSELTSISLPQSVTAIGFVAFQYCSQLTKVTMGDNISFIDACAFNLCPKLSTFNTDLATEDGRCIIIDSSLVAFAPYGVTTYQIPDGVICIEKNVFDDCSLLEEIILPNTLSYIGNFAFDDCISLSEIVLPNSISYIGNSAFRKCTGLNKVVVDNISTWCNIEFDAFYDDSQYYAGTNPLDYADLYVDEHIISELRVPDDITEIKPYSFINYDTLTRVYLHKNVQKIGYAAFNGCHNLSKIYCFGSHIILGSQYMFSKNLTNMLIYVPASDDDSIINAYKIAEYWSDYKEYIFEMDEAKPANNEIWYTASEKVELYDKAVFGANYVSNEWDSETGKGIITFDGDVTMIGEDTFYNCSSLTSVTIPDSVTTIENWAFRKCSGLVSVTIGDGVTTIGEAAFAGCSSLTEFKGKFAEDNGRIWVIDGELIVFAPAGVTEYTIPNSVTTIGAGAFALCSSLTSVTIPDSVVSIGNVVFYDCSSLTSVTIPDSVTSIGDYAFSDCASLTSVTIGDSVTTIGGEAFSYCASLTSVTIGDSVTTIGDGAFSYCDSLTSVTIGDSVTTIGAGAFALCNSLTEFKGKFAEDNGRIWVVDGELIAFVPAGVTEYTIPNSVTSIGDYAFFSCSSLTSVTIGDSVMEIGIDAFACYNLTSVYCEATIPPILGYQAFHYNASGRRIYVYEECVDVYKSAWSDYSDSIYTNGISCPDTTIIAYTTNDGNTITSSKFPIISNSYENGVGILIIVGKIAHIPAFAFRDCYSLTSVTIPDSVTKIGYGAFQDCNSLTNVTIPDSVTAIGDWAFAGCSSLKSVTIPDSVVSIGDGAFWFCSSLTSVTIPDSVVSIGNYAFDDCRSLASVTIPDSVVSIEYGAFVNCSSLTSVYCKATTPPMGGGNMFDNNPSDRKIYVPTDSVEAYRSAQYWSEYADAIVGYDF